MSCIVKNKLFRSRRFTEVQCLDITWKTNNYNRPLACATCVDSEGKNVTTQTSLLESENEVSVVFSIFSIGLLHIIHLRSVPVFISDNDKKIIATVCRLILVVVFNFLTKLKLCYCYGITLPITKVLKGDDTNNLMSRKVLLLCTKIASWSSKVEEHKFYWEQMTYWLDGHLESKMISSSLLRKSSECLTSVRVKMCFLFIATTKISHWTCVLEWTE